MSQETASSVAHDDFTDLDDRGLVGSLARALPVQRRRGADYWREPLHRRWLDSRVARVVELKLIDLFTCAALAQYRRTSDDRRLLSRWANLA